MTCFHRRGSHLRGKKKSSPGKTAWMSSSSLRHEPRMDIDAFIGVTPSGDKCGGALRLVCMVEGLPAGEVEWTGAFCELAAEAGMPESFLFARTLAMCPSSSALRIWMENGSLEAAVDPSRLDEMKLPSALKSIVAKEITRRPVEMEIVDRRHSPALDGVLSKAARAPHSRALDLKLALADIERLYRSPARLGWTEARTAPVARRA